MDVVDRDDAGVLQAGEGVQTGGMTSLEVRGKHHFVDVAEIIGFVTNMDDKVHGMATLTERASEVRAAVQINSEITARAVKGALTSKLSAMKDLSFGPGEEPLRLKGYRITRKIGAPGNPEYALGAVSETGAVYWNQDALAGLSLSTRDLAIAVHEDDERLLGLVLHHQCLDHGERVQPEHLGAVLGAAMFQVLVRVFGEGHPVLAQQRRGRGFAHPLLLGHRNQRAGSRSSQRMASICCSNSGLRVMSQALRFSSSCAAEVTPMMVLATLQR